MRKAVIAVYTLMMAVVCALLIFAAPVTDYYCKRLFRFENTVLIMVAAVIFAAVSIGLHKWNASIEAFLQKHTVRLLPAALLLLLALQIFLTYSAFFYSDWDPAAILSEAFDLANGLKDDHSSYFSAHPNNLLPVWIHSLLLKTGGIFGKVGEYGGSGVMIIVYAQCLLNTLSGFLLFRIVRRLCGSFRAAWSSFLFYALFLGLSPWLIITYTDQLAFIFPLLTLRLWQIQQERGRGTAASLLIWGLMGLLAPFGYRIKPQTVIMTIAVTCVMILEGGPGRVLLRRLAALAAGILLMTALLKGVILPSIPIGIEPDRQFGMAHYLMMGLNGRTSGVYDDEDTEYTNSFDTPAEKAKADLDRAGERLTSFGAAGLKDHLIKKTLVNFNDGTFAWGLNGNFFAGTIEGQETFLSSAIRKRIYTDGEYFGRYSTIQQLFWLFTLFTSLGMGAYLLPAGRRKTDGSSGGEEAELSTAAVIALALIGITVFELVFEALARYLFIYAPVWVAAAAAGRNAAAGIRVRR